MTYYRQFGRNRCLDYDILKNESEDHVQEGINLIEIGKNFEKDKSKLENEIEKVKNSKLSDNDKSKLIDQLEGAIAYLQIQYDKDVTEAERKVEVKIEDNLEYMQEAAEELERQADSMRGIRMETASTDASAAAEVAQEKKKAFEKTKHEYEVKLKAQMDMAEIQRRNILKRRLSGR